MICDEVQLMVRVPAAVAHGLVRGLGSRVQVRVLGLKLRVVKVL